jgi:hypothetical protein
MEHADLPFPTLVERLGAGADPSRNPVFQAMLTYTAATPVPPLRGLSVEPVALPLEVSFVDVSLELRDDGAALAGTVAVDAAIYDPVVAERIGSDMGAVLAAAVADPGIAIGKLPVADLPVSAGGPQPEVVLPERVSAAPSTLGVVPGQVAATVADVWSDLLGHDAGDFFAAGGTSLLAIRMVARLRAAGIAAVTVRDVFETRTPATLAARLAERSRGDRATPAAPVRRARAFVREEHRA